MFCLVMGLAFRHASTLISSLSLVEVEALPSHRVLLSRWSSVVWPPPTSQPASAWISPLRLIPFVTVVVAHRPDEISPVSSFTFATSHSPYAGGFFTDAFTGSSLLPLAFADPRAARLPLGPFLGRHFGAARFILYCGLLLCSPFSGGYNVSAHLVAHMHWLPATWPPVRYQDWTSTSKQTMTFQDTPRIPACGFSAPGSSEVLASVKVCHAVSGFKLITFLRFGRSTICGFTIPNCSIS